MTGHEMLRFQGIDPGSFQQAQKSQTFSAAAQLDSPPIDTVYQHLYLYDMQFVIKTEVLA